MKNTFITFEEDTINQYQRREEEIRLLEEAEYDYGRGETITYHEGGQFKASDPLSMQGYYPFGLTNTSF